MASVTVPTAVAADAAHPARRNYSRIIEQTWIWSMVGYSLLRFFIAGAAFSEHGANIWIFGIVDVGTAWPYGKSVAVVCKRVARSEWKRLPLPVVAAIVMFFAPYAYLWIAAGTMPAGLRAGMAILVSVLFVAATIGVLTKSRKLRREARERAAAASAVVALASLDDADPAIVDLRADAGENDVAQPEMMIDLTTDTTSIKRG